MSEFDDFLADFYSQYDNSTAWGASCLQAITNARISWNVPDDHAAIGSCILAVEKLIDSWLYWHDAYTFPYPRYNLVKLLAITGTRLDALEVGAGYELTLVKMIEAYIDADDDHRSAQRLLFDAYQASMYDKPFDQEYHALWIQRFRSWV